MTNYMMARVDDKMSVTISNSSYYTCSARRAGGWIKAGRAGCLARLRDVYDGEQDQVAMLTMYDRLPHLVLAVICGDLDGTEGTNESVAPMYTKVTA